MLLQRVGDFIAELERVMFRTFGERSSSVVHTWEDDVLLSRPCVSHRSASPKSV